MLLNGGLTLGVRTAQSKQGPEQQDNGHWSRLIMPGVQCSLCPREKGTSQAPSLRSADSACSLCGTRPAPPCSLSTEADPGWLGPQWCHMAAGPQGLRPLLTAGAAGGRSRSRGGRLQDLCPLSTLKGAVPQGPCPLWAYCRLLRVSGGQARAEQGTPRLGVGQLHPDRVPEDLCGRCSRSGKFSERGMWQPERGRQQSPARPHLH